MKFAIIFLAVLGLAAAAPSNSINKDNLRPAVDKLLENVNLPKLKELIAQLSNTEDGKKLLAYLQGPEIRAAIDAIKAESTIQDLLTYAEQNGLPNIREVLRQIGAALGIKPSARSVGTKNLSDLVDQLLTAVDTQGLLVDALDLLANDVAVQNLFALLSSDKHEAGWKKLKVNPAILVVTKKAREEGLDVDAIIAAVEGLLGYSRKNAINNDNLRPALDKLLENLNLPKLKELIAQLSNTEDGKKLLAYLQGPEIRAAIDAIKAESTIQDLLTYAEQNGLPNIREVLRQIGAALGIKPSARSVGTKNLSDLVDELLTAVDIQGLLVDALDLLANDKAVQNLFALLSSDKHEAGWKRLKSNAAILTVTKKAREEGLDVDAIIAAVEGLLGYGSKNAINNDNLRPALDKLLENLNLPKLKELIAQLSNTEDGKKLLAYLQGPEIRAAIDAIKAEYTIQDLLTYLEQNGLPNIREVLRQIGAALGIKPSARSVGTKNLSDLVDELLTAVDIQGLLVDVLDLLAQDKAVQNLVEKLSSDENEAGWKRLKSNAAILTVTKKAREEGLDVDAIIAAVELILGYN